MDDLIKRSDAIKAVLGITMYEARVPIDTVIYNIKSLPSADRLQDDEYKNFDRGDLIALIEAQEERIDELLADRPQGEWIRDRYWSRGVGMGEEYGFFYKCSMCEYEVESGYTRCGFNYCPYCGADMKGADDEV